MNFLHNLRALHCVNNEWHKLQAKRLINYYYLYSRNTASRYIRPCYPTSGQ